MKNEFGSMICMSGALFILYTKMRGAGGGVRSIGISQSAVEVYDVKTSSFCLASVRIRDCFINHLLTNKSTIAREFSD